MSLSDLLKRLAFLLPLSLAALSAPAASAADGACAGGACGGVPGWTGRCASGSCCPGPYRHCTPKVPGVKYKCACGKPLCDMCDVPGYGYYPTCWRAWDQPLNYHCVVPTPTQLVPPPAEAMVPAEDQWPSVPRR
jgi:hypothetical protein